MLSPFHNDFYNKAKLVDFHGYKCALYFDSIINEVLRTRTNFGVFDLFHMGRILIYKDKNFANIQKVLSLKIDSIYSKNFYKAKYALILNDKGNIEDDVVIYDYSDKWLIVCNAANKQKNINIFKELELKFEDVSNKMLMLAIQGPRAKDIVQKFSKINLEKIYFFEYFLSNDFILSRTGYTGEDGFELYSSFEFLYEFMKWIKKEEGEVLCGLGSRDVLRIEAGLPLYGNELDDSTNPLEANLSWAVNVDRVFQKRKELKYFSVENQKRVPRKGDKVLSANGSEVGYITSGTFSPTLQKPIGMLYLVNKEKIQTPLKVKDLELILYNSPLIKGKYYRREKKYG